MTRSDPPRFDANSALDALPLLLGLVAWGLWRLGGWLLAVPEDAEADFGDEGESA